MLKEGKLRGTFMAEVISDTSSVHPWWLRVVHWANAAAIVVLVMSGWQIYNGTGFLGFHIPMTITLGGWLGGAIQWHFAAIWVFFTTAATYLIMGIITKRLWTKFFPLSIPGIFRDLVGALTGKLSHADIRHYNFVQKAAYLFAMVDILVLIASGLVLWKNVQLPWLRILLGGYETARYIHFGAMAFIVAFFVVHVLMALLVPKTIKAMIWGR